MSSASPEISPLCRDIIMVTLGFSMGMMLLIPLVDSNDKLRKRLKKAKRELRAHRHPRLEKTA